MERSGSPGGRIATWILARRRCRERGWHDSQNREPGVLPMAGGEGAGRKGRCLWELERCELGSPRASERTQLLSEASRRERRDLSCLEPAALWPGVRTATGHQHAQRGQDWTLVSCCSASSWPGPVPSTRVFSRRSCKLGARKEEEAPPEPRAAAEGGKLPWRPAWVTPSATLSLWRPARASLATTWTACPPPAAGAGLAALACDGGRRGLLCSICDLQGATARHEC